MCLLPLKFRTLSVIAIFRGNSSGSVSFSFESDFRRVEPASIRSRIRIRRRIRLVVDVAVGVDVGVDVSSKPYT